MNRSIDKQWFMDQLRDNNMSLRGLAKSLEMDPSALSRVFSGQRKMQIDEAKSIAHFLRAPVSDVMKHAGVSVDLDGAPARVVMMANVDGDGYLEPKKTSEQLPPQVIEKAGLLLRTNRHMLAAHVKSPRGAMSILDDAIILFMPTETVERSAIGALAIVRDIEDGRQCLVRLIRARKTGEATIVMASGELRDMMLETATPVVAIIP